MDISGRGISVGANRQIGFQGNADQAANLLAEIGVSLRSSRGQGVQGGFLRLLVQPGADGSGPQFETRLRRVRNTGSNAVATDLVRELVRKVAEARGQPSAVAALDTYLRASSNRIGSQSFIKLLQAMGIDDAQGSIARMTPVGGRLVPDQILEPHPEAPDPGPMEVQRASARTAQEGLRSVARSVSVEQQPPVDAQPVDPQPVNAQPVPLAQKPARPVLRSEGGLAGLFDQIGLKRGRKLGQGSFGLVFAGKDAQGRENCAFKILMGRGQETINFSANGKLVRSGEIMAAYLDKSDDPEYGDHLNVVRPDYMMILEESASRAETLLVPRERLKQYLHEHGEKIARGESAPQLKFKGTIMPLMPSGDLEQVTLKRKPLSEAGTAMLYYKGIDTLMGLGSRGLIHRDIKPANIFFDEQTGDFHLADFGLMTKRSKTEEQGPPGGIKRDIAGTYAYLHPAVIGRRYGPEVDLFSFAVTALEAQFPGAMALVVEQGLAKANRTLAQYPQLVSSAKIDQIGFYNLVDGVNDELGDSIQMPSDKTLNQFDRLLTIPDVPQPTPESFAMACLNQASRPQADWATREMVGQRYQELLQHPYMQEVMAALSGA